MSIGRTNHLERIRHPDTKIVVKKPPRHLPQSFFKPEYLAGLQEFEKEDLDLSKRDIAVYDWGNFDPYDGVNPN
ncbi:hypothetical protein D9758_018778 [Tetrapyrgos nigripes]|uniref:Uncharacterized protein n=1 Tax=Tetrapyrgos nigripes TaxID=182062 RepID=A0A8H5BID2_9AGAR|nr:hypothetical protein D9758_018778 [Tetrapyrgos nigripes]